DEVRLALSSAPSQPQSLKDSTIRTILRRLEEKGFLTHTVEGRTYCYEPTVQSQQVATDAVRGIIDQFCDGSVEELLVGMVDSDIVSADVLKRLADKIARAERDENQKPRGKKG
ncbi:MAG: BlaI/MecI/CopY family transcriptional regulator, partial [Planctomycetales bacterium]|nr:BlaI/MecI/CopY family transcriptional regulator [Planctomycetales bacterium]